MYQAITTKYLGPTNTGGSRVKATSEAGNTVTVYWDHGLSTDENHIAAARILIDLMEWHGKWAIGATPKGYVFVRIDDEYNVIEI